MSGAAVGARVKLWDLPTRLTHWGLVALVALSWFTAETDRMVLHRLSGYAVLGLVMFRILWGLVGSSSARFASFVKGPRRTWAYLRTLGRRAPSEVLGHNPIGAWSVLAMLLFLAVQAGLGLFAVDVDGLESGPLSHLVSFEDGRIYAERHEQVFNVLLVLIGLHIVAVAFYLLYKRDNLIGPMVTGARRTADMAETPGFAPVWRVFLCAALASGLAWWVSRGLGT
jgi:cytochrome b